jgi:hypothetical protein
MFGAAATTPSLFGFGTPAPVSSPAFGAATPTTGLFGTLTTPTPSLFGATPSGTVPLLTSVHANQHWLRVFAPHRFPPLKPYMLRPGSPRPCCELWLHSGTYLHFTPEPPTSLFNP